MNSFQQLFNDRDVLIVFSDPGGAKPMLALNSQIAARSVRYISNRFYPFYNDFQTSVESFTGNVAEYFNKPVSLLLTGTSYTSDIELQFIAAAKQYGVPSISYIDHYTGMRERFVRKNVETFPDAIWLIDEEAEKAAIEAKLPVDSVIVMGNPYHEWLRNCCLLYTSPSPRD